MHTAFGPAFKFAKPLEEAIIKSRPNRFLMNVDIGGSIVQCHCPTTGRIGDIVFEDIPCLFSKADNPKRKTKYTVEAISLDPIQKETKSWIGINQAKANTYLEHFLRTGQFNGMLSNVTEVNREVKLGKSRIDFNLGFKVRNTFLEAKSPLTELPFSTNVRHKKGPAMKSFNRLIKHFHDLAETIDQGSRAIVLLCYQYDAPPFRPPPMEKSNERIEKVAMFVEKRGLETWQANMEIDKYTVSLISYFRLKLFE